MLGLFNANLASAQFYDSADDIYFYINIEDPRYCIVLNFDGKYATFFNHTYQYYTSTVSKNLNINSNYFANLTSTAKYRLNYISGFSGVAYLLRETRNGFYGTYTDSYLFLFSADREKLYYQCYPHKYTPSSSNSPSKQEVYKRVPKEYFISEKVGRSDSNKSIIYD